MTQVSPEKSPPPQTSTSTNPDPVIQVYRRRWLVLAIFTLYSCSNAFQWIEYGVIADKVGLTNAGLRKQLNAAAKSTHFSQVANFYDCGESGVNWLALIYEIVYAVGILPANEFVNNFGLLPSVIIGAVLNAAGWFMKNGGWIKVASASPSLYWVSLLGQALAAAAQLFVLGLPPILAAVWFGADQVATATAIGVFGNQVGVAVGFLLPPLFVTESNVTAHLDRTGDQLRNLFYFTGGNSTILLILILLIFRSKPPHPPSLAQAAAQTSKVRESFFRTIKYLFMQRGFILIFITYGINAGTFYAYSTLLNAIVLDYSAYKGEDNLIGYIGLTFVVAGIVGSILVGPVLDRTHKYKLTTLIFYFAGFAALAACIGCLYTGHIWTVFLVNAFIGFFTTGYLPIGFEFCVEITYPVSEITTASLLNLSAQLIGIMLTFVGQAFIDSPHLGASWVMGLFSGTILVGAILSAFIPEILVRQQAEHDKYVRRRATTLGTEHFHSESFRSDGSGNEKHEHQHIVVQKY